MRELKIVIGGAGKVGSYLARWLSPFHNVVVIDRNRSSLDKLVENLDLMTIEGDLREESSYKPIDREVDFFIGVTDNDEINLLSPLVVGNWLNVKEWLIRINNPIYFPLKRKLKEEKKILLFPLLDTTKRLRQILFTPKALYRIGLDNYEDTIMGVMVKSPLFPSIEELERVGAVVIGRRRMGKFEWFPTGPLTEGEVIYLLGQEETLRTLLPKIDTTPVAEGGVLILGATPVGLELAKWLVSMKRRVYLIEKDETKAEEASEVVGDGGVVIQGTIEEQEMLYSEGLGGIEIAVTTLPEDELNIISALTLRRNGIKRIITTINNISLYPIIEQFKIGVSPGMKVIAFQQIVEEINSRYLVYERFFLPTEGVIYIKDNLLEHQIEPPTEGYLIIKRGDRFLKITDRFNLQKDDKLIYFSQQGNRQWIENL
jgi:trk system potassium uptake protein TrkA